MVSDEASGTRRAGVPLECGTRDSLRGSDPFDGTLIELNPRRLRSSQLPEDVVGSLTR